MTDIRTYDAAGSMLLRIGTDHQTGPWVERETWEAERARADRAIAAAGDAIITTGRERRRADRAEAELADLRREITSKPPGEREHCAGCELPGESVRLGRELAGQHGENAELREGIRDALSLLCRNCMRLPSVEALASKRRETKP